MKISTLLFSAAGAGALLATLAFTKNHSNSLPPEVNAKSSLVRIQGDAAYRDLNKTAA